VRGPKAEEVAAHVQIGTQMLGRAEADAGAGPGADGTLLAVVPIPGTGTSLAIVGYPVPARGSELGGTTMTAPAGTLLGDAVRAGALPPGTLFPGLPAANPAPAAPAVPGPAADGYPGLQIDADQRRVWTDGTEVPLTFQEFELLAFLTAHPGTVFSRADLVREVWQRDFAADSRTVDVHVSRLRHKLGPAYGRCLVTEYRIGYQFRP
jgi:transcriptional regulator